MDTISLSKKQFENLEVYDMGHKEHNSEGVLYILNQGNWHYSDGSLLVKKIYRNESSSFYMKMFNINSLNSTSALTDIKELVIPEQLVVVDGEVSGFTVPRVYDSTCLGVLLKNLKIDGEKKIEYLAKVGKLLKKIKSVNEQGINFALGDLHEYNFLITNDTEELKAIDLDSVYLGTNYPAPSYYLNTSKDILYFNNKYKPMVLNDDIINNEKAFRQIVSEYGTKDIEYIIYPDHNSDLFCYNMMILNAFIARDKVSRLPISKYFEYINYLEDLGFGSNIIRSFQNLYTDADNINPTDYLDEIPVEKLGPASYKVFELKKQNNKLK